MPILYNYFSICFAFRCHVVKIKTLCNNSKLCEFYGKGINRTQNTGLNSVTGLTWKKADTELSLEIVTIVKFGEIKNND